MARAKRVRWECPHGLHPGVLGSTRPAGESMVRFCVQCSLDAGVLVRRTAPALERKRAARSVTATEKRQRKADRERQARANRYVVATADGERIDLAAEMQRMFRDSAELRDRARESGETARWRPKLTVRRGGKSHVSGHCEWDGSEVTLTVGAGADSHAVRETLLHELVHAVTAWGLPGSGRRRRNGLPSRGRDWHGSIFRTALCRASRELFGTSVHPDDHAEAYGLDRLIKQQMRSANG